MRTVRVILGASLIVVSSDVRGQAITNESTRPPGYTPSGAERGARFGALRPPDTTGVALTISLPLATTGAPAPRSRARTVRRGAIIGALAGAAGGGLLLAMQHEATGQSVWRDRSTYDTLGVGAAAGAIAGALIGALVSVSGR